MTEQFTDSHSAQMTTDWGPFGRPLFDDPTSRALSRVGVIDIGSNSVRMVVFDGAARSPAYFYNEKVMCGLGAGLTETGRLNPQGRERAISAIRRFAALAATMDIPPLTAVATAAVREAADGDEFRQIIEQETGIKIFVIDGPEEARLSAQGVLLGWPQSYGLVCDIGGSSMELAELSNGKIGTCVTSPLGPLRLRAISNKKALKTHIRDVLLDLHQKMGAPSGQRLFLVGGSWRAIARVDMERRNYPMTVLHEYRMTPRSVATTTAYIESANIEGLRNRCGISADRMSLVPLAIQVLRELIKIFKPKDIAVSSYGIREGMLYQQMPTELRERDPLIEACRYSEAKDARMPGYGKVLYDFVSPLFPNANWQKQRIIKAACLLHDVTWRSHPDYRHEVAFDFATRANLGGLKHEERVYLGLALLHRYSNKRDGTKFEEIFQLAHEDQVTEAEVLGKAMRLGSNLWLRAQEHPGELLWRPKKRQLTLVLNEHARPLWGEAVENRFNSLAKALNTVSSQVTFSES